MCSATHYFNLCAVSQLLNSVAVLGVKLQQNGHLEGGCLKRKTNINVCVSYEYMVHTHIKSRNLTFQELDLELVSEMNQNFKI